MNQQLIKKILFTVSFIAAVNGSDLSAIDFSSLSRMFLFQGGNPFSRTDASAKKDQTPEAPEPKEAQNAQAGKPGEEDIILPKTKLAEIARRLSALEQENKELKKRNMGWLSTKPMLTGISGLFLGAFAIFAANKYGLAGNLKPFLAHIPVIGNYFKAGQQQAN